MVYGRRTTGIAGCPPRHTRSPHPSQLAGRPESRVRHLAIARAPIQIRISRRQWLALSCAATVVAKTRDHLAMEKIPERPPRQVLPAHSPRPDATFRRQIKVAPLRRSDGAHPGSAEVIDARMVVQDCPRSATSPRTG